jgi:hypothetical protein
MASTCEKEKNRQPKRRLWYNLILVLVIVILLWQLWAAMTVLPSYPPGDRFTIVTPRVIAIQGFLVGCSVCLLISINRKR